ncbi:MAG TPA: glycosyltransferase family 39 protein [Acidimicrobiales bacterium]
MALTTESPPATRRRTWAPVLGLAAGVGAVHVVLSGRFGFHQDELYLLAAGRHPALGYVDQPPLAPLLVRGITALIGEHLWPLRVVSGAAHAGLVVVMAAVASVVGGGRARSIFVAALAAATMPVFVAAGARFDPSTLGLLCWALALWAVVSVLAGADPRWWLGAGAALGATLEATWTGPLLAGALILGLVLAPGARRHLLDRWAGAGALVALVVWLPNLVWQALNHWPVRELHAAAVAPAGQDGLADFVVRQIVLAGPAGIVLGVVGVGWAWGHRPWRALAVPAVLVAAGLVAAGARAEDLGFAYVVAVPAGVVCADAWAADDSRRWNQTVAAVAAGLILVPLAAPITSLDSYTDLYLSLDASLAEEVGADETAALVARVYDILPAGEKENARVIAADAGVAATLDLYGPAHGLPRGYVMSPDRSYADWWPDRQPAGTVIFVNYTRQELEPYCDALGPVAILGNSRGLHNESFEAPISVCSVMKVTSRALREGLVGSS